MKFSGVVRFLKEFVDAKEKPHVAPSLFDAVLLHESWHVISCVFISVPQLPSEHELQLHAGPVRPPRGRFWKQFFISNGSGGWVGGVSHNGDTLSDLLGMHCGRQRGSFDLGAYAHRSVPCLKTDLLFDFVLPKPSEDLYLFSGKKNLINKS